MSVDVATLKIQVDASQVQTAINQLGGLSKAGFEVEMGAQRATIGTSRLNSAFLLLARQATGTHPAVARLADVMFSMALGGARMTAVLGGLAAVALAYRKLTEDAREARAEAERLRGELDKLGGFLPAGYGLGQATGQAAADVTRLQAEIAAQRRLVEIRGGDSSVFGRRAVTRLAEREAELSVARGRLIAGQRAIELERRERTGAGVPMEDYGPPMPPWMSLDTGAARLINGQNFAGGSARLGVDMGQVGMFGDRLMDRQRALEAAARSRAAAEDALAQRRKAANDALVISLANVGRAYGGVTDQVLNLTAATMSIYQAGRLPGFGKGETATRTDMAIGMGSAVLSGIGFGASTGSAGLGGLGGGLSGFAMAGPYGAIVGAVGGIVAGLFEAGRRAEEAARVWGRAFEDFDSMFDDQTSLERNLEANKRTYEELQRAAIEIFLAAPRAEARRELDRRLAELNDIYQENITQAEGLAKAEKDLHDARRDVLQALNSPAGLNLAAYGYAASSSGMNVQGDFVVVVDGAGDPHAVAARVFEEGNRIMRRGGTSPYLDVQR